MSRSRWQKTLRLLSTFVVAPLTVGRALPGELRQRHGSEQPHLLDESWHEHLHDLIGATIALSASPALR